MKPTEPKQPHKPKKTYKISLRFTIDVEDGEVDGEQISLACTSAAGALGIASGWIRPGAKLIVTKMSGSEPQLRLVKGGAER